MLARPTHTASTTAPQQETVSPEEARRLVRELRSHQAELEQQNETLKTAQLALLHSFALLDATLEAAANGILVVDLTGKLLKANHGFAEMWRIPTALLAAGDDSQLLNFVLTQLSEPATFIGRVRELYAQPAAESCDFLYLADGRVLERISKPMFVSGVIHGRVWSFLDITPIKQAEAQKAECEAGLRRVEKAESLGRMAGAIAHHFNNYLHAVMGNLELTLGDPCQSTASRQALNSAMHAATQAATISSLMVTYLGLAPGGRQTLDLTDTCQQFLPILQAGLPKEVTLSADFRVPGPVVKADAHQLQQVLTHLVTNAWEACGGRSGAIGLSIGTVPPTAIPAASRFPVSWQPLDQPYACLEVMDSGPGIPTADINRLFDPFFTNKFIGRGMGLAVTMGLVQSNHGAITVMSQPGQGSTFRVYLPALTQPVPLPTGPLAGTPALPPGGTVLLVDDDRTVRQTTSGMLKRLGFTVLLAEDGVAAITLFRARHPEIRCVLCDLTMPRLDGWETMAALRQLVPGIPVILVSGYDQSEVFAGEHAEPPQAFLSKPYTQDTLREVLARLVGEHGLARAREVMEMKDNRQPAPQAPPPRLVREVMTTP